MQFYFTVQNVPDVIQDKNFLMKHPGLHALDSLLVQHYLISFYKVYSFESPARNSASESIRLRSRSASLRSKFAYVDMYRQIFGTGLKKVGMDWEAVYHA